MVSMCEELIKQMCSSNSQAPTWGAEGRCLLNILWNLIDAIHFYQLCTKSPDYTSVCLLSSVCPDMWVLIRTNCCTNMPERVSQTVWLLFIFLICFIFQLCVHFHICVTCEILLYIWNVIKYDISQKSLFLPMQ